MKTVCIFFILLPVLMGAQVVRSHQTTYFDKDWNSVSEEKYDYKRTIVDQVKYLSNGDSIYPYKIYDKKNRLRYEGFVNSLDSSKYIYVNSQFNKKGQLIYLKVRQYQKYLKDLPADIFQYYRQIEPYLQDSFIQYTDGFDMHVEFKKNGKPGQILVIDPECCCTMTRLRTLLTNDFEILEDVMDKRISGREFWFYRSGGIKSKAYKKDGIKFGKWEDYSKDGKPRFTRQYENDKLHGESVWFYKNGLPRIKRTYLLGELNGTYTKYYKNGNISYTGVMKNGERDKTWTYYNEDGTKKYIRVFDADRIKD